MRWERGVQILSSYLPSRERKTVIMSHLFCSFICSRFMKGFNFRSALLFIAWNLSIKQRLPTWHTKVQFLFASVKVLQLTLHLISSEPPSHTQTHMAVWRSAVLFGVPSIQEAKIKLWQFGILTLCSYSKSKLCRMSPWPKTIKKTQTCWTERFACLFIQQQKRTAVTWSCRRGQNTRNPACLKVIIVTRVQLESLHPPLGKIIILQIYI